MPLSFTTKQSWALALLALVCLGIVGTSIYLIMRLVDANWWVDHTLQVQKEAQSALICLMDCETAYRGYLVSGQDQYLEPYEHCYRHVASHIQNVQQLTRDNPEQQAIMPVLFKLAEDKIKFSQLVIAARKKDPRSSSNALISLEPGKKIMDQFRSLAMKVMDREQLLLEQRIKDTTQIRDSTYLALVVLSLSIGMLLIWIARNSRKYVAEQYRAQAEILSMRDQAITARNEAIKANELKSQFVANISHEVRTPMSGILGLTELLDREETDPSKKETIGFILGAAQNLMLLVNDLLDFSKLESGHSELVYRQFYLPQVVDEAMQSVYADAKEKNLIISKKFDSIETEPVCGDPDRIRQILLNLLHNAVKFTENGQVTATVRCEKQIDNTAFVRFEVVDTGIGLPETMKESVFLPFVQADGSSTRKYSGTGLGLSICKKLVGLMNGFIGCENNADRGAKFWFTLPLEVGSETKCQKSKT
jgi:two-component system, sensor histidine kinase and response regulator